MKYLKMLGLAALAASALMAFVGASTASATTLETTGVTENKKITLKASLEAGTTATLRTTSSSLIDTCTESTVEGATESPFSATKVTGAITSLTFGNCSHLVTVHNAGKLYVEHIAGTTNGTVGSEEAEVTVKSTTFGIYANCTTGSGTHLGTLTGVKHGHATMHVSAVIPCTFVGDSVWEATYVVTSPTDLGVSA